MRGLVLRSFAAGSAAAFGIMGALAVRTAWAVTKGHRWYQVKKII